MREQFHTGLKLKKTRSFITALSLTALLMPVIAFSAERDGTVLFFSFEDLQKKLSHPTPSQWLPNFAWRSQQEQYEQMTPLEQSYFWGNGLGIDGYARPGARRPLWSY
jgi:hypothetical protein